MSHPVQSHYAHPEHYGQRSRSAAAVSRHRHDYGDYTLTHAGRQVRIGPVAFWIVVGTLVVMAVWSIATGSYFAFREDVLTRLIGRQAEMQFAYEDRVSELRAQIDRITSRQLLDQEQFEQKLEGLLRRQSMLEQRTSTLAGDLLTTGSIRPTRGAPSQEPPPVPLKPSPLTDNMIRPPDQAARLQTRMHTSSGTGMAAKAMAGGLDGALNRIALSLDRIEDRQVHVLSSAEENFDAKARRIRGVLADLGVNVGNPAPGAAVGGPFVPAKPPVVDASAFERQLYRIRLARLQLDRYTSTLAAVPVRKPVLGEIDMSSPFGMRMDPFVRGPAIHTGIDMRGDIGDPVRTTATGTVTVASWNGGYGKMVEIDHGNGFTTRYGHLSQIDVQVGQFVRIGQIIGRIGSTGRSTGPHLHYETRINDEAVDPQKFLRAGDRLGVL